MCRRSLQHRTKARVRREKQDSLQASCGVLISPICLFQKNAMSENYKGEPGHSHGCEGIFVKIID